MKRVLTTIGLTVALIALNPQPSLAAGATASRDSCDNSEGLPPVGNQVVGGSCYAWASAYYHLSHLQWQEFGWDMTDPAHQCSPAFVYNLTNGGIDNGAWEGDNARWDGFLVLETLGCATMADMPYSYTAYLNFPSETAFRNGMRFRTLRTDSIDVRSPGGIQRLKDHLLAGNTAVLGFYGYANFQNLQNYDYIYCVSEIYGARLYWHDVCVVGFDDSLQTADGMGAFRIVNSFGPNWGDNGFFWMSYEAVMHPTTSYGYVMYATDRIGYEPTTTVRLEVEHADRYRVRYSLGLGDPVSPDTSFTYFIFHPMSIHTGRAYPSGAVIVLDFTDMAARFDSLAANDVFLQAWDTDWADGRDGTLLSAWWEDLASGLCAVTTEPPLTIPDANQRALAATQINYSVSPPTNLTAVLDTSSGEVTLAWEPPADPQGLTTYHVYRNEDIIDSTTTTDYTDNLPGAGSHRYVVSAVYPEGESLQPMASVYSSGYGLPFADGFEAGLHRWFQIGDAGIYAVIVDDPVYEGQHAVGVQTNEADDTFIAREFDPTDGLEIETMFNMASYPIPEVGIGAAVGFLDAAEEAFGIFVNADGHLACMSDELITVLDSTVSVALDRWYKHRIWYYQGGLHAMLMDDDWNVLVNAATGTPYADVIALVIGAWGLDWGWNYFDDFSVEEWTGYGTTHFTSVEPTSEPYALVLTEALLDGDTLQAGDEIAVYDWPLCVGAYAVDGEWPLILDAWGTDGADSGFTAGNPMVFRVWSASRDSTYEATAAYEVGGGSFADGVFSRLALTASQATGAEDDPAASPTAFALSRPRPSPFDNATTLALSLPEPADALVSVFNAAGREVAVLADGRLDAGVHRLTFNATEHPSGVYFIRATVPGRLNTSHKAILIR
jgi:hypothetical protein